MAKLFLAEVPVVNNGFISPGSKKHKTISFLDRKIAPVFKPGQFVTVDCGQYLRRPFSIAGVYGDRVEIIYKIVSKGTQFLASRKKGQKINILGPLGNGFSMPRKGSSVIAVVGGTGIAPIMSLLPYLAKPGVLFYGARTKYEVCSTVAFIKKGWRVFIATEDGSAGEKGTAVDLAAEHLGKNAPFVYAAGPKPMLKKISEICLKSRIKGQVSVEEMIACGVGACRGCVIKVRSSKPLAGSYENRTVCKDGPVFNIGEIIW